MPILAHHRQRPRWWLCDLCFTSMSGHSGGDLRVGLLLWAGLRAHVFHQGGGILR